VRLKVSESRSCVKSECGGGSKLAELSKEGYGKLRKALCVRLISAFSFSGRAFLYKIKAGRKVEMS